ncbi:SAM-dependent methyltransferase [Streptomyces sp. AJS327]|uniref:SAM-dependent methyltransferase n=1 Tax=Streptomyces sp. AJS327 TaxID=2545265 RepID=UPI0015DE7796|nr:SAM-dependent methyltransferase [Streptomyces sp. AJS327]MBA0052312.1 SAM-dependent methyltransferase [Streptomyces sp. AJS327]
METAAESPRIDTSRPHPARMYDYYLGGTSHYAVDARAAEEVLAAMPGTRVAARVNRDFMARATRTLAAGHGVRQFLDIGTGIPTEPNLHQVAQSVDARCRVVYTDNDPIVLHHARALLRSTPEGRTAYVHADVTAPETILDSAGLRETLDLERPVALSVNALFHFITDAMGPHHVLRTLLDALAPGSFLVMTHATADFVDELTAERTESVLRTYREAGTDLRPRSLDEFRSFFTGLEPLEPGLVVPQRWRPDCGGSLGDAEIPGYAGVARLP